MYKEESSNIDKKKIKKKNNNNIITNSNNNNSNNNSHNSSLSIESSSLHNSFTTQTQTKSSTSFFSIFSRSIFKGYKKSSSSPQIINDNSDDNKIITEQNRNINSNALANNISNNSSNSNKDSPKHYSISAFSTSTTTTTTATTTTTTITPNNNNNSGGNPNILINSPKLSSFSIEGGGYSYSPQKDLKIDDYFNLTTTQIPNSNLLHRLDSRMVGILGEADINKCKEIIPKDQHFITGYSLVLVTFNTILQPKLIKTFTSSPVALLISDKSAFLVLFDTRSQTIQQVESCDLTEIKDVHSGYMSSNITNSNPQHQQQLNQQSQQQNLSSSNNSNSSNNNNSSESNVTNLMEEGVSISPRTPKKNNLGSFVLRIVKIKGSWVLMGYSPSDSPEVQREKIKTIEATVKSIIDKAKMQHKIESKLENSERTHIPICYYQPRTDVLVEGEIYFNLKKFSFIQKVNNNNIFSNNNNNNNNNNSNKEDYSFSIDLISIFECRYTTSTIIDGYWELKIASQGEKSNNQYFLYLPKLDIENITKNIARMITESQDIALLGYDESATLDSIDEINSNISSLDLNDNNTNSINIGTHNLNINNSNNSNSFNNTNNNRNPEMNNSIDRNLLSDNNVYRNLRKIQTTHETIDLSQQQKELIENNFYLIEGDEEDEDHTKIYTDFQIKNQFVTSLDNNKPNCIPTSVHFQGKSDLLKEEDMLWLQSYFPTRLNDEPFELVYSTLKHGISIRTFFSKVAQRSPCILVIKDDCKNIFGAYTSDPWNSELKVHYGSGETFLFKLTGQRKKFSWTRKNDNFMFSNGCISLGTGDSSAAFGLWIDEDLYYGSSVKCNTFDNDVLAHSSEFKVLEIEVWSSVSSKAQANEKKQLNARDFFGSTTNYLKPSSFKF